MVDGFFFLFLVVGQEETELPYGKFALQNDLHLSLRGKLPNARTTTCCIDPKKLTTIVQNRLVGRHKTKKFFLSI